MKNIEPGTMKRVLLAGILGAACFAASAQAPDAQRTFESPEAAAKALVTAASADDESALVDIFGAKYRTTFATADKTQDREARARFARAAAQYQLLRPERDGRVTMVVGTDAWPLPIPLVRSGATWRFDSAAGAEEMVNRRIGGNELAAIRVLTSYGPAQQLYASTARDGSGVHQFAQRLGSTPGRKDGLYWEAAPGEPPSPFGPLLKEASSRQQGEPYYGYYYRVLKGQGAAAPGGRYSYVINGRMLAGYALLAYPAQYGVTGIKSFIVNHYGDVYEKDLGAKTGQLARAITEYNPDKSWSRVED
jgi:hypothetical protein